VPNVSQEANLNIQHYTNCTVRKCQCLSASLCFRTTPQFLNRKEENQNIQLHVALCLH